MWHSCALMQDICHFVRGKLQAAASAPIASSNRWLAVSRILNCKLDTLPRERRNPDASPETSLVRAPCVRREIPFRDSDTPLRESLLCAKIRIFGAASLLPFRLLQQFRCCSVCCISSVVVVPFAAVVSLLPFRLLQLFRCSCSVCCISCVVSVRFAVSCAVAVSFTVAVSLLVRLL